MAGTAQGVIAVGTTVVDLYNVSRQDFPPELRRLAPPDTLFLGYPSEMPPITDARFGELIAQGGARAGGQGNTLPQIALSGVPAHGFACVGAGEHGGLDSCGDFLRRAMQDSRVEPFYMPHAVLPTGVTFIVPGPAADSRPGIVYFPNANLGTDLAAALQHVAEVRPNVLHWMYVGLMGEADRRLPEFFRLCREEHACIISADTHTLLEDPSRIAISGAREYVNPHTLLPGILKNADIFFCSVDEAVLIADACSMRALELRDDKRGAEPFIRAFLEEFYGMSTESDGRRPLFGVTVKKGAYLKVKGAEVDFAQSNYLVDFSGGNLVGAGDAFRAGLLSYVARHAEEFRRGGMNYRDGAQMGNLVALLSISAPPGNRFGQIGAYEAMEEMVRSGENFRGRPLEDLVRAIGR